MEVEIEWGASERKTEGRRKISPPRPPLIYSSPEGMVSIMETSAACAREHNVTLGGDRRLMGAPCPPVTNAAPRSPLKMSISTLMRLPEGVTEPELAHY